MAKIQQVCLDEVIGYFDNLEDPRSTVNWKHPLVSVVVIAMMAVLAGAGGPTAIAKWATCQGEFLAKVLSLPNGIPRKDPRALPGSRSMSDPAVKIIVRSGKAYACRDSFGGPRCVDDLLGDMKRLEYEWARFKDHQETKWTSLPRNCEGGYLLDFDTKTMLLYERSYPSSPLEQVQFQEKWPGWRIRSVKEGVADFVAYLNKNRSFFFEDAALGGMAIKPQDPSSGQDAEAAEMGRRSQKVVVRSGKNHIYYDRWGADVCEESLLAGIEHLEREWATYQETDWIAPYFCEAGYLLDFDAKTMLFYQGRFLREEVPEYVEALIQRLQQGWPNWKIVFVEKGVPDFQAYLGSLLGS